jgi:hypothetical protein
MADARSGLRATTRTFTPSPASLSTIRLPRNPVPPKTVIQESDISFPLFRPSTNHTIELAAAFR